jgi:hypothetical protein
MQHRHHPHKHSHKRSAAGEMLTRAGLEGLLASIPTVVLMTVKETVGASLQSTLRGAIAKGEKVAGEAVSQAAGKFKMSTPVVVGAVIIGAAVLHGAWRGKRKHEERSFAEAEEERRAQREEAGYARAGT